MERLKGKSKLWNWTTLPLAMACLLLGVFTLHSLYESSRQIGRAGGMLSRLESLAGKVEAPTGAELQTCLRALRQINESTEQRLSQNRYWGSWLVGITMIGIVFLVFAQRSYLSEIAVRRQMECLLKQSEASYRSLFENVLEGVYRTSTDGRVLAANPALVRMLGYSTEEELKQADIGRDIYVQPEFRQACIRQLEEQGFLRGNELQLRRRDGSLIVVLENALAVRGKDGATLYYEGTLTDITERKRSEEEMRRHMEEAEQARQALALQAQQLLEQSFEIASARDEAVLSARRRTEFLGYLSRRAIQPAAALAAGCRTFAAELPSGPTRLRMEKLAADAEFLERLALDLGEYARLESEEFRPESKEFSPRQLMEEVIDAAGAQAESKGLELCYLVSPSTADSVVGDARLLRMVLTKLLDNAMRFTSSGEVSVRLTQVGPAAADGRTLPESACAGVPCAQTGRKCVRLAELEEALFRFEVEDTGDGIPSAAIEEIFQPFARPRSGRGGTGLGLAISRRAIEKMRGQWNVKSEPGQGSLFTFTIPLGMRDPPQIEPEPTAPLAGRRILIADDSACTRGMLAELCAGWGMKVQTAGDGNQALHMLQQAAASAAPFEFALLDCQMPPGSGVELAATLLELPGLSSLRIILLAPHSSTPEDEEAVAGIAGSIRKPVLESRLKEKLLQAGTPTGVAGQVAALAGRLGQPAAPGLTGAGQARPV